MNDKELLKMAAKAVGFSHEIFIDGKSIRRDLDGQPIYWNPLTDDGDALRLAVRLRLLVDITASSTTVADGTIDGITEIHRKHRDARISTRYAIVRAAAEIGKAMP